MHEAEDAPRRSKRVRRIVECTLLLAIVASIIAILFAPPGFTPAQRAYMSLVSIDDTEQSVRERNGEPLRIYTDEAGLRVLVYRGGNGVEVALRFDPGTGERVGGSIQPDP